LKLLRAGVSDQWQYSDLLQCYLESVDTQLGSLMKQKLGASGLSRSREFTVIFSLDFVTFSLLDEEVEHAMISFVELLQQIIIDLYYLFVKNIKINDKRSVCGLINFYFIQMTEEAGRSLDESFSGTIAINLFPSSFQKAFPWDQNHIKSKIKTWLQEKLSYSTEICSNLLSSLSSAVQVAQIQQVIFSHSTRIMLTQGYLSGIQLFIAPLISSPDLSSRPNGFWLEACTELLRKTTTRKSSGGQGPDQELSSTLLWSTVFRVSFLHQVERLLYQSCEQILNNTQTEIFSILELFGIDFSNNLQPKIRNNTVIASLDSSKIFFLAESVRKRLDSDLSNLVFDVISPVSCVVH
jgi:hypothetical protein